MNRQIYKRLTAFIMCLLLLVSDGALPVYAGEIDIEDEISREEEIVVEPELELEAEPEIELENELETEAGLSLSMDKKYGVIATGNCGVKSGNNYGDNLKYELYRSSDDTLTLTISGSGDMGENCYTIWKSLYTEIKEGYWNLVLGEGITSIGNYAFAGPGNESCIYIFKGSLDIPDSVTSIGLRAFYNLQYLTGELVIPEYVETIEADAFYGCGGFAALPMNIPESVSVIGARAFRGCQFPSYYLPESITLLGNSSNSETFPFPAKIDTTPVTLIVLKETYAYTWADENRKYGYEVEIGQKKYRIFYDVNCSDGTVEPKIGVLYEERQLGELTVPIRPGYTFLGWYTDPTDGDIIKEDDICYGDILAYAHWSQNEYDVSFDPQGGRGNTDTRTVIYDEAYGTLPTVTRNNYDFVGWYTDPVDGTLIDEASQVKIPKDHTLYAHWLGTPMTVTFDKMEGEGEANDRTVYFGSPYGTLPELTKEHCKFLGWYTKKSGGDEVTKDTVVTELSDHTLYAHWEGVTMNVIFFTNGDIERLSSSLKVMYGSTYGENGSLPVVSRDDKDFDGWYTAKDGGEKITDDTIVKKTEDHNLYAHWGPKHVKVSFNPNGGSSVHPSITVLCESPYGELPTPTHYGYVFDGWFTSGTGGFEVKSSTIVEDYRSHTLYAHWRPKTGIRVSFDPGVGSVTADDIYVTYNSPYARGSSLPIGTRESYEFAGWYTEEAGGHRVDPDTIVDIEDDHVLHARWRGKAFTVTFETGETAGIRDTKTVYYDDYYGGLPTPTKYGCKFEGWYTDQTGDEKIEPTTKVLITEDQKLYARWSKKICLVTYELDGGTNDTRNPITYTMSDNTLKLYDPYRLGYKFAGWYVGPKKLAKEKITQISRGMAEDITLYAKWTVNTYKITYAMGISATNPNSRKTTYRVCDHNTAITKYEFKAPSKKGYVFEGWYLDPDFTEEIKYIDGTFEGNIKLYAKWRGATYYLKYHADDAIAGSVTPTMHQYKNPDSTVSLGEGFIKEGYHVLRWYFDPNLKGKFITPGSNKNDVCTDEDEIVDVYAYFTANNYYVSFEGNGATGGKMKDKKYVFDRDGALPSCSYKKTGYLFDTWNTEPDGSGKILKAGQKVRDLTTYNEETVTLYAQWKPISYYVEFNPGSNGKGKMGKIQATYDELTDIPLNTFTRPGYDFKLWRLTTRVNKVYPEYEEGRSEILNACSQDRGKVTLKAIWQYTVSFDPNCSDYSGYMADVTFDADKYYYLPANEYERPGYTFMGWAMTSDAAKRQRGDKARVNNLGNITLYAVWKAK